MKEIPYLFTTLIAHSLVLRLDNRRSIKIDNLINFRSILLKRYLEHYQKFGDTVIGDKWEGDLSFAPVNDTEEILTLLKDYPEIFYYKDECLCIYENIDLTFLNKLMNDKFSNIRYKFHIPEEKREVRNSLGITKVYELGDKIRGQLQKIEKQLEEAYNNIESSKPLIKELLSKRFLILINVIANHPILIQEYHTLFVPEDKISYITEDYDYIADSVYTKNNEPYPIDDKLYRASEFYEDAQELDNPIQCAIEDIYHEAIFSNKKLYEEKSYEMMMQFNFQDFVGQLKTPKIPEDIESLDLEKLNELYDELFEKDNEVSQDGQPDFVKVNVNAVEEEFTFWLTYVHKLNEYLENNFDENLIKARNRLLYLLDDIARSLYIEENFEKVFAKTTEAFFNRNEILDEEEPDFDEYEDDDFSEEYADDDFSEENEEELPYGYLGWESGYLIHDCFSGREYKTIEKLLLISTYYYLTEDEDIIDILNQFKDHPKYSEYEAIITGRNYTRSRKLK